MNYFKDCETLDDAKTLYRKLSFELHPDTGGEHSAFIEMRRQFEAFRPAQEKESDKDFDKSAFYDVVKKFNGLEDIEISFVGTFIWLEDIVTGATYGQREQIKAINIKGYNRPRYARKKQAWYFSPEGYKQKGRSRKSLDEIKNTYGCKSFESRGTAKLTA